MELLDFVAAKFHEEGGVFKLLVYTLSLKRICLFSSVAVTLEDLILEL